jgi:hypothetical protein
MTCFLDQLSGLPLLTPILQMILTDASDDDDGGDADEVTPVPAKRLKV